MANRQNLSLQSYCHVCVVQPTPNDPTLPPGQLTASRRASSEKVGIAAAKAEGKYTGRAPTAQARAAKVLSMHAKGVTKQDIAAACDIRIASVYRILKAAA
jgi:CRP-like cAMP-binding protein